MKIKKVEVIVIIIVMLAGSACMTQKKTQTQEPEFVFFYAENQSEDFPTTKGAYKFAELVEERSQGRIQILVQAEGKLGTEKEVLEQLQFGGIDFARISISQLAACIPEFNLLQMPYLYEDAAHMWEVLDGVIGELFLNSTEVFELVGLSWYDAGARNFYNSVKPIHTLEDIKGLKIRVQESDLMIDVIEALGAIAVPMAYDEVYASLERGLIDGAENNGPSYESTGHYEVAPYYTVDEHTRVPEIQLCGEATWKKLSLEDQEIIRQCARESALYERALWTKREESFQEVSVQNGIQSVILSTEEKAEFREKMASVYEKYCAESMDIVKQIIEMRQSGE